MTKWSDDECFDRIASLVAHDNIYDWKAKAQMLTFLVKIKDSMK